MNLIEKYLAKAAGKDHVAPGQDLTCKVSFVAAHDVTAPIAIRMFREIGVKKVFDPSRVALIVDHVYPAATEKARANVWAMDDFSKEFGVPLYQRGEGVIHQLMYEKHKQNPGDIVCIADSHTGTCGGYGQIGIGVGSTELAAAMATGTLDLEVPQVVQIYLTGKRPSNVFGKDLILYLGSKFGSDYLVDRGLLLTGPGIDDLSIAERMTVCNMGIEIGSMITIFGTEEKESDCFETYEIDLSTLEPQISCPFSPANVVPVREKAGIKVTQVVVGSCTNGRLNDMEQVAQVLAVLGQLRQVFDPLAGVRILDNGSHGHRLDGLAAGVGLHGLLSAALVEHFFEVGNDLANLRLFHWYILLLKINS